MQGFNGNITNLGFAGGGGGTDPSVLARLNTLENNEYKITYFTEISAASGAITPPTDATILLDQLFGGIDAYVCTIQNDQPTGIFPKTAGGITVDVASFDAVGNYTLTGTPDSFPVALIYILKIKAVDYSNLIIDNILDLEDINIAAPLNEVVYGSGNGLQSSARFLFNNNANDAYINLAGVFYIGKLGGSNFLQSGGGVGNNLDIYSTFTWQTGVLNMNGKNITNPAIIRLITTTNSSPQDGDFWFDGTDYKARTGGVTKTFTLS